MLTHAFVRLIPRLSWLHKHFDEKYYLSRYSDVRINGGSALVHYLEHGQLENRQPRADFDPVYYRWKYSKEIGAALPFEHWITVGRGKGYAGHPWIKDPAINDFVLMSEAFDREFYRKENPDVTEASFDLFDHFIEFGWKEYRDPAPWFSLYDYLAMNPELLEANVNPFSHYLLFGKSKGLLPARKSTAPSSGTNDVKFKDIDEYIYFIVKSELDRDFYLSQFPEDAVKPADCVLHYIFEGAAQGLDPNDWFSTRGYLTNNEDVAAAGINPLYHFVCQGKNEQRSYKSVEHKQSQPEMNSGTSVHKDPSTIFEEHLAFTLPGPDFEELDPGIVRSRNPRAKLIAFYLPQFHAIPENDAWWGKGFTEWRNVIRGQPRYRGHQQPRVPEQLGFYDLTDPAIIKKQVALAKSVGIHGFCFYYYNFNGRRLLEMPIESFLADRSLDFHFALMWANENWTRTWDGMDHSILLKQEYAPEDDPTLLADFARHFSDPRYIRIDGRPLIFIYRPSLIPNIKKRIKRWRAHWDKDHGERPLLFMAQGFEANDPAAYDLDGAIEFPPHKICKDMKALNSSLDILDPKFRGHVISYAETVERAIAEPAPKYPLIKTAAPSWDNEARRPGRGMTLHGATPAKYERWLRKLVDFAEKNPVFGEPFVAVNAWNEWAEGAYLEPDAYHGAAYLNATARALTGASARSTFARHKILIVGHDAYRHGAQLLVRGLAEVFSRQFGLHVELAICGEGPLMEEYRAVVEKCSIVRRRNVEDGKKLAMRLANEGISSAIVNTTVAAWLIPMLKDEGFNVTSLIHELPQIIDEYGLEPEVEHVALSSDSVLFPAALVKDLFIKIRGPIKGREITRPQGLYRDEIRPVSTEQRSKLLKNFGIPLNAKVVINVGFADMRKGFDIFLHAAIAACAARDDVYFLWVGNGVEDVERWQMSDISKSKFANRIRLTGYTDRVEDYYAIADVFFLTSREDPFPSVVLEAFAAGVPVVAVRGVCGTNEIVQRFGKLVDLDDKQGQIDALCAAFKASEAERDRLVKLIRTDYRFDDYCFALARTLYADLPKVSVVVPNFNYAHYLDVRLNSIFRQSHPVFEVIVLDDASSDNSRDVIAKTSQAAKRKVELVVNEHNSGSVFHQWRKGVERARGDYVWIAEADDDCDERFLQVLLTRMIRTRATFGFSDSSQVGSNGERLGDSYRPYLKEDLNGVFETSFSMAGKEFLARFLSVKNVILNISGALFRRDALLEAMENTGDDLFGYKVAGDWRLYVEICAQPGTMVTYEAEPLNIHRRHQTSVTQRLDNKTHFEEIQDVQIRAARIAGAQSDLMKVSREAYLEKVKIQLGLSGVAADRTKKRV